MKHALLLLFVLFTLPVFSQKMKTVEGEYTYYAPENVTPEEAKRIALERAKIQALADAFGTIVSQTNSTHVKNSNGKSDIDFMSIGGSEVKGEWIETTGEPLYNISYEQGMLVIKVSVKDKAREMVSAQIDIKVKVLRNGTEDKFESDEFHEGDDLYLSFVSPVSGYLAVYLVDAEQKTYCLLPYQNQEDGIYNIKSNKRYLFFNKKEAEKVLTHLVDEYTMTCSKETERNTIYIVFSPNAFAKACDNSVSEDLPRALSYVDFQKWITKQRKHDEKMNTIIFPITIKK